MRKPDTKTWILLAVMCVVTALLTWLVRFDIHVDNHPVAGYWTMGDVGVYVSAALLGGPLGAIVAGVASALGDLLAGQAIYMPASLILKAAMAFLMARFLTKGRDFASLCKAVGICGLIMVLGYFLYDLVLRGDYAIAALGLPINLLQVIASAVITVPVLKLIQGKTYEQADPFTAASANTKKRQLK